MFFHISAVLSFLLASSSTVWMYQSLFIHSTSWLRQSGLGLFFFFLTEVLLIYSVSGTQQSDSAIHLYLLFFRFFSITSYYKMLDLVPCATQEGLVVYFMYFVLVFVQFLSHV